MSVSTNRGHRQLEDPVGGSSFGIRTIGLHRHCVLTSLPGTNHQPWKIRLQPQEADDGRQIKDKSFDKNKIQLVDKTGLFATNRDPRCTTKQRYLTLRYDEAGHELIERHMLELDCARLRVHPYRAINGPRRLVRRLLQQLHAEPGGWLRSLDVDVERVGASRSRGGIMLDEVQCARGSVILAIKTAADRDRRPRRFFLSGVDPIP